MRIGLYWECVIIWRYMTRETLLTVERMVFWIHPVSLQILSLDSYMHSCSSNKLCPTVVVTIWPLVWNSFGYRIFMICCGVKSTGVGTPGLDLRQPPVSSHTLWGGPLATCLGLHGRHPLIREDDKGQDRLSGKAAGLAGVTIDPTWLCYQFNDPFFSLKGPQHLERESMPLSTWRDFFVGTRISCTLVNMQSVLYCSMETYLE